MEDQAEFGLFLSNDVCRQQRGLLCPGNQITSFKDELFTPQVYLNRMTCHKGSQNTPLSAIGWQMDRPAPNSLLWLSRCGCLRLVRMQIETEQCFESFSVYTLLVKQAMHCLLIDLSAYKIY